MSLDVVQIPQKKEEEGRYIGLNQMHTKITTQVSSSKFSQPLIFSQSKGFAFYFLF